MKIRYFNTAWTDIKESPGWIKKIMLLALLNFVPIFGQIVTCGYLYGWARDIAWNLHRPLPQHIFGDEDGKLYSRGFFVFVLAFVLGLIVWAVVFIGRLIAAGGVFLFRGSPSAIMIWGIFIAFLLCVLQVGLSFFSALFGWVGAMRISIYSRLSAGFQFKKIWAMIRHDFSGLLRIFGMALLLGLIIGIVWGIVYSIVIFIVVAAFVAVGFSAAESLGINAATAHSDQMLSALMSATPALITLLIVALLLFLVLVYVFIAFSVFVSMTVTRALGYWTRQFDVASWRGQDDPMPFEIQSGGFPSQR